MHDDDRSTWRPRHTSSGIFTDAKRRGGKLDDRLLDNKLGCAFIGYAGLCILGGIAMTGLVGWLILAAIDWLGRH